MISGKSQENGGSYYNASYVNVSMFIYEIYMYSASVQVIWFDPEVSYVYIIITKVSSLYIFCRAIPLHEPL